MSGRAAVAVRRRAAGLKSRDQMMRRERETDRVIVVPVRRSSNHHDRASGTGTAPRPDRAPRGRPATENPRQHHPSGGRPRARAKLITSNALLTPNHRPPGLTDPPASRRQLLDARLGTLPTTLLKLSGASLSTPSPTPRAARESATAHPTPRSREESPCSSRNRRTIKRAVQHDRREQHDAQVTSPGRRRRTHITRAPTEKSARAPCGRLQRVAGLEPQLVPARSPGSAHNRTQAHAT